MVVTTADQYKVVYDPSISAIFNDLNNPLTHISRWRQYSTLNVLVTVEDKHVYNVRRMGAIQ